MKGYIVETRWDDRDPDESEIIYNREEAEKFFKSINLKQIYDTEKMTAGRAFKGIVVSKTLWPVYVDEWVEYGVPLDFASYHPREKDDWFEHHHIG